MEIVVFWFRRDLRLTDNTALTMALSSGFPVLPLFIFDQNILSDLPSNDPRLNFIHKQLKGIHHILENKKSSLLCKVSDPITVWESLLKTYRIKQVFFNKDYEPYAIQRDRKVEEWLNQNGIEVYSYKDQVIFEENEIVKDDGNPYTVFTPYKKKWLKKFNQHKLITQGDVDFSKFYQFKAHFPSIIDLGFETSLILVKDYDLSQIDSYEQTRNHPGIDATSYLGAHLRFGTVSIREIIKQLKPTQHVFLSELIWREFFMQILYHFPKNVSQNFKSKYDAIKWRNDEQEFEKWKHGKTGFPLVDAGMRQLNQTGFMHNRVRMVAASFLIKHLLIDWKWGEAYFAEKLLDYELSSNNGNWQWVAGTGSDAAPYFRIFNPMQQLEKFDKEAFYVKKWIPELGERDYPAPMVDHLDARERALKAYKINN